MTFVVFGATGRLGQHVLRGLHDRGVPASRIVAAGRDLSKLEDQDVRAVRVDYDEPGTIRTALAGATRALLISGSESDRRVAQHAAVIDAAAGLELLAYTSTPYATESAMLTARDHAATETLLRAAGVPWAVLRNSIYLENLTEQTVPQALATGSFAGASGKGRFSPASRADLGDAAAAVLTEGDHAGAVYELGGDRAYTMDDVAAVVSAWSGKPVRYDDVPAGQYREMLVRFGLPETTAEIFADMQVGIGRDECLVTSGDLTRLIGRPATSLEDALAAMPRP